MIHENNGLTIGEQKNAIQNFYNPLLTEFHDDVVLIRIVVMGGDGTLADVINTMILRQQQEVGNDVNDLDVTLVPTSVKLGIIPAGNYIEYFFHLLVVYT